MQIVMFCLYFFVCICHRDQGFHTVTKPARQFFLRLYRVYQKNVYSWKKSANAKSA